MKYYDREGKLINKKDYMNEILKKVYSSKRGISLMEKITNRKVSSIAGRILDSSLSRIMINPFVSIAKIELNDYEDREFVSYNDFFTRKMKDEKRIFSSEEKDLCSPCDGKLSVYKITNSSRFNIKNAEYSVESLLKNKNLANEFDKGYLAIFRLSVDNYHRYSYIDSGYKTENIRISGKFYSVDPAVTDSLKVYKENEREYTIINTTNFGKIIHMEVGATLVGKIVNHHDVANVKRGQEKGYFEFGGSTIMIFFKENKVEFCKKYIDSEYEHEVYMGDIIGRTAGN